MKRRAYPTALCPSCATTHAVVAGTMTQHVYWNTAGTHVLCPGGVPGLRVVRDPAPRADAATARDHLVQTRNEAARRWHAATQAEAEAREDHTLANQALADFEAQHAPRTDDP